MGTTYSIKILNSNIPKDIIKNDIDSILNIINLEMSTYIDSSEISRFNKSIPGSQFYIGDDFYKVVSRAKVFNLLTFGLFDPTINPLVKLWGFSKNGYIDEVPSKEKIDSALEFVGMENLLIDNNNKSITKKQLIELDLSAIAKGYGVDRIGEYLNKLSLSNYMIEIGGEIKASGYNKEGMGWVIGIQNPASNILSPLFEIELVNMSLATSGNYRNYYDIDGKKYSHIISPLTGYPIDNNILSVSVLSNDCINADALATALMLYEPNKGVEFIEKIDKTEVLYILEDNSVLYSNGFESYFSEK